mmetsp:Transcript_41158/g.74363  ORF Transcript_41158/g.74363 Transcript_41158/m.74363 type:complete len:371 (-) Transcript_41158:90-1202(-)
MDSSEAVPVPGHFNTATTEESSGPILWFGLKFDKACGLRAEEWIRFGSSKHVDIRLDGQGFSQRHCQVRWSQKGDTSVELRNNARGSYLNGVELKGETKFLDHGDCLTLVGKDKKYEFLLDLRPLGLVDRSDDPRKRQARNFVKTETAERKKKRIRVEYAAARDDKFQLEAQLAELEERIALRERAIDELSRKRERRIETDKALHEEMVEKMKETIQMVQDIQDKRRAWEEKILALQSDNEVSVQPYTKEVVLQQSEVDKLRLKRVELLHQAHPERFALLDESKAIADGGPRGEGEDSEQATLPSTPGSEQGVIEMEMEDPPKELADHAPAAAAATAGPGAEESQASKAADAAGEDSDDAPLLPAHSLPK